MGAFDFGLYEFKIPRMGTLSSIPTDDELRCNWAIQGIQRELLYRGLDPRRTDGVFGWHTGQSVKKFQKSRGLRVDGRAGSLTLRKLFTLRMNELTADKGLPPKVLCGLIMQESGFDPAAVGFLNPNDRGLLQINKQAHPTISDSMAFNAQWSMEWGADRLVAAYKKYFKLTKNESLSWKCAIANHNSPADASSWAQTGNPPDEQIENYVNRVLAHCGATV